MADVDKALPNVEQEINVPSGVEIAEAEAAKYGLAPLSPHAYYREQVASCSLCRRGDDHQRREGHPPAHG